MTNKVQIIDCVDYVDAVTKATIDCANCNGAIFPVVIFGQGNRLSLAGAMPIALLNRYVGSDAAKRGDSPSAVEEAKNRPLMTDHVAAISHYLLTNAGKPSDGQKGTYIIPPVTLNVKDPVRVYTPVVSKTPARIGYLVLPASAKIDTTDGQHRIAGSEDACEKMSLADREFFERDSLSFMLTCEEQTAQIHQDFADCSKTKPIPPSILAVYDRRVPVNGLVLGVIERCPVFTHKIDSTGKTLGKNAIHLFTTNQIRQFMRSLLTHDIAMSENIFVDKLEKLIPDLSVRDELIERYAAFINLLADHVDVWKRAAAIKPGPEMMKIRELRQKPSVLLTVTGLNVVGCVGYQIFNSHKAEWREFTERLGKLNYEKNGPLWSDILVAKTKGTGAEQMTVYQIATNRGPVMRAVAKVAQAIGLDPEPEPEEPRELELVTAP